MAAREIQFGRLTLQPGRQLLENGTPVSLARKPLDILSVLAAAEGNLVTKDELMQAVWPGLVVEENAIQAHMVILRKALGSEAERLKTVRGFGYRLEVLAASELMHKDAARDLPSVAILPFANLTGDPAKDYLADGMAEELTCTLARCSDLNVPARTSTFAYKGRDRDIREIARELGVRTVLEGSVRAAGERIRVTVQLIDAVTGFHLWSENYDRDLHDLIKLQDDIAHAIADTLLARLTSARRRTVDADAFDLCLRARSLMDRGSPENLLRAIDLFEDAVMRDPEFAEARVGLSKALANACSRGVLAVDKLPEALEQARLACELDPDDADAHAVFGCGLARSGDWISAAKHLELSVKLHEDADVHAVYGGGFLLFAGRRRGAEYHTRRAREIAPAAAITHVLCGGVASFQGRHEDAKAHMDAGVELGFPDQASPLALFKASEMLRSGNWEAAAHYAVSGSSRPLDAAEAGIVTDIYRAAAGCGSVAAARAGLEEFLERARAGQWIGRYLGFSISLMDWALILEDRSLVHAIADLVVEGWSRSGVLDLGCFMGIWREGCESWRQDPHLLAFFRRIGVQDYWDAFGPPD